MSGLQLLLAPPIAQSICDNLTFQEAHQLWSAYSQTFPGFQLNCSIPIFDRNGIINSLPHFNKDSPTIARHIALLGSIEAFRSSLKYGLTALFKFLLNTKAATYPLPLSDLSNANNTEIIQILIEEGIYTPQQIFDNVNEWGNDRVLNYLLSFDVDIDREVHGKTGLQKAVRKSAWLTVKFLLERGADPNKVDKKGNTPLNNAVEFAQKRTIKLLLNAGADPNIANNKGITPLYKTVDTQSRYIYAGSYWGRKGGGYKPDIVKYLVGAGADPNIPNNRGITPLILAIERAHYYIVKTLLDLGADPNLSNPLGPEDPEETPLLKLINLQISANKGTPYYNRIMDERLINHLLEAGANPNVTNDQGETPLLLAVSNKLLYTVDSLLNWGADPNIEDNQGRTPISIITEMEQDLLTNIIIRALISHGAQSGMKKLSWRQKMSYLRHKF